MTRQKTFALLGHPVGHSVSPAMHRAVYDQFGFSHRYIAIDCPDEASVQQQCDALRAGALDGVNITVPWKRVALELSDAADVSATETGAANVWCRDERGKVVAHNTDAAALAELLANGMRRATTNAAISRGVATVLGNGGAALAAVVACRKAGATEVFVSARKWRGEPSTWPHRQKFLELGAMPLAWLETPSRDGLSDAARQSRVIVQASSAGMLGVGNGESVCRVIPWSELPDSVFVYDVVYNPERTPFLERALLRGLHHEGGLSMLVGQAALAVRLWLGVEPDRQEMHRAAAAVIFGARG